MSSKNYYECPTQVLFVDEAAANNYEEGSDISSIVEEGIAYKDEVICLECGSVIEMSDIVWMEDLLWISIVEDDFDLDEETEKTIKCACETCQYNEKNGVDWIREYEMDFEEN